MAKACIRFGWTALGVATFLLAAPSAEAQSGSARYRFTTVLDNVRDGLEATRCAAINSFGRVAVQVRDDALGINKLITRRSATDAPLVVADTRSVPDFPTTCDNGISLIPSDPSINELGEVGFQANLRRLTTRPECSAQQPGQRQGIFLGQGGPLTAIAHTFNQPGGNFIAEFLVADQSVNTLGQAALVPELDNGDEGLYVGSRRRRFDERFLESEGVFDGISSRVSLNEVGQIAFDGSRQDTSVQGIFLSNPDGTFRTIVDSAAAGFGFVSDPSLNLLGRVAFQGSRFVDDTQVLGIYTSRGGPVTTVAENTGPYDSFREPSLNDLGEVAFTADLDEIGPNGFLVQGVFTGPDPVRDKVLQAGDLYEGVPVSSVVSCSEALNNLGQIVMTVQSENPETFEVRTFVVKATPR